MTRKRGGNLKIIIGLLLIANSIHAGMIPTGYNSWYDSEERSRHIIECGNEPANYWDGVNWIANDPSYKTCANGFCSINNRHFVFVDTLADIVRFSISDSRGNVHVLKSKIGPLFLLNRTTADTLFLSNPNLCGYGLKDDRIEIPNVYPGVTCYIWNRRSGLDQQFVFSPAADTLIDRSWREVGCDTDFVTINVIELLVDSLNLAAHDAAGQCEFTQSRDITGDINFLTENEFSLFMMPEGWLEQGSRRVPLYRHIDYSDSQIWLCEGFRNIDISTWPRFGFKHNDSRSWQNATVTANLSAFEPGTSFYSGNLITAHTDSAGGIRMRGLIWFDGLIDSLQNAAIIDSALLSLHYCGDLLGQGTLRICRGITDSAWYNSGHATWNARYKVGNDSAQWAGGWAVHVSSFTAANSVSRNLADTNAAGYYQFPCKDILADMKSDGTDWGFWVDNGPGSSTQRASFDSGIKETYAPYLYIEYRTSLPGARRLKLEK